MHEALSFVRCEVRFDSISACEYKQDDPGFSVSLVLGGGNLPACARIVPV